MMGVWWIDDGNMMNILAKFWFLTTSTAPMYYDYQNVFININTRAVSRTAEKKEERVSCWSLG
jgi:hypothetical protein